MCRVDEDPDLVGLLVPLTGAGRMNLGEFRRVANAVCEGRIDWQEYIVDPIEDLRPVCPNCHAMLHRRKPAVPIEEAQKLLQEQVAG